MDLEGPKGVSGHPATMKTLKEKRKDSASGKVGARVKLCRKPLGSYCGTRKEVAIFYVVDEQTGFGEQDLCPMWNHSSSVLHAYHSLNSCMVSQPGAKHCRPVEHLIGEEENG